MKRSITIIMTTLILLTNYAIAEPLGTGFTYQGELNFQDAPANGAFDFEFNLFEVGIDGAALTAPYRLEDVNVQDGVFSVELDFGTDPYTGEQLWLDIKIREGDSVGGYTGLLPRQKLTSAPYALEARIADLEALVQALQAELASYSELLAGVSRGTDPNTSQDTLTFTNMNVQIVSGSGTTNGETNGKGNLIIGYNEFGNDGGDDRTGSHTLIVGKANNYSSYGALVAGGWNEASAPYASVSGGIRNTASGWASSVSGGSKGAANEDYSSVSGGRNGIASGLYSTVSGGHTNTAGGHYSSVSGGSNGVASGQWSSVSGGSNGVASGQYSSVSGGEGNTADGHYSSVSGGRNGAANEDYSSVSGGHTNTAVGLYSTVSGGYTNTASGWASSVSGGQDKTAGTNSCWTTAGFADC